MEREEAAPASGRFTKVRFQSKSTGAVSDYVTIESHAQYGKDQEQCARLDQCGGNRPQICTDKFGANNENAQDLGFMFVDKGKTPAHSRNIRMSVGDYMLVGGAECDPVVPAIDFTDHAEVNKAWRA